MTVPPINSFENIKLTFAVDQPYSKSQYYKKKKNSVSYIDLRKTSFKKNIYVFF